MKIAWKAIVLPLHHCRITVGAARLELAASRSQTERSAKLSYAPIYEEYSPVGEGSQRGAVVSGSVGQWVSEAAGGRVLHS